MNDDELRNRLARLDPQADAPVDPITSPRAQDLLERTMTTDTHVLDETHAPAPRRNRLLMAAAAAVAAAGIVAAVVITNSGGSTPAKHPGKTSLALKLPGGGPGIHPGGPSMGSCVRFEVSLLKAEPVAFAGKATEVTPSTVTITVTKWYKGGTADQVTVANRDGSPVTSEGGLTFEQGKDYLVSANDGTVVGCGFSGEATTDLQQAYSQAFG